MRQAKTALVVAVTLALASAGTLVLMLALATFAIGVSKASTCDDAGVTQPPAAQAAGTIPTNYLGLYQKAGRDYGIGWNILAAVGKVESDHGRSNAPGVKQGANHAGAKGPMQFLQATWDAYGVDGNRDGARNVYDPADAIPGAAKYLKHSGAPTDLRKALFAYNHADWYVDLVLKTANTYATGGYTTGRPNTAGTDCAQGLPVPSGQFGEKVVGHARKWIGVPYSWGGGNTNGPSFGIAHGAGIKGFDCSGLTLYAVYHASGGKISLAHYTGDQWNDKRGHKIKDFAQLQVGDLMFFGGNLHHVAIYSGAGKMIEAPYTGQKVREVTARRHDFAGAVRFGTNPP